MLTFSPSKGKTSPPTPPQTLTMPLHSSPGVADSLPGGRDVQEDGVGHARHAKALLADVLVADGDQVTHAVFPELLAGLLSTLLVELHRVQVARGRDGTQDGVGQRSAARTCGPTRVSGLLHVKLPIATGTDTQYFGPAAFGSF